MMMMVRREMELYFPTVHRNDKDASDTKETCLVLP